jgi:methyl-accepting chemotaxis protein
LSTHHLLAESTPCTVQAMAGVLHLMVESYRMPDNVAKALTHVAVAIQHIDHQNQKCESANSLPMLIKDLQNSLSTKINGKLSTIEKRINAPSPVQEQLNSVAKDISQAAESIKASINDMGNSIVQVTDTSSKLASTATNYKDTLLKSNVQQQ